MPPSRKNDRNRRDGAEVIFIFQNGIGEYPYRPERLDAVKEIKDFVSASAEEYLRRGLQIKIGAMPNGAIMEAGPTYFRSILINLLDNSAKYEEEKIMRRILIIRGRRNDCRH